LEVDKNGGQDRDQIQVKRIVLLLVAISLCARCNTDRANAAKQRQVNLYVWSAYIPNQSLRRFERESGIRLRFDTYDSNEALLEKLQSGVSDYDVIVPSDYMVTILIHQKLLQELDLKRIPNRKNIAPRFFNLSYDPGNRYSVPFLWSTSGIGYNRSKVLEKVDSWGILWDPKYKNRMLMLDDMRESFGAALRWKGHSYNTTDRAALLQARDLLLQQKPLLKAYNSTNFDEMLLGGDVWITHAWSGNVAMVMEQNHDLDYVIPKEGSVMAVENFCIPVSAKHPEEAYAFIDFMLDAKVGAEITNYSYYPNTNEAAIPYIKPEILNNPACYHDEKTLSRCELVSDLGPTSQLLDRYWTEIKSR